MKPGKAKTGLLSGYQGKASPATESNRIDRPTLTDECTAPACTPRHLDDALLQIDRPTSRPNRSSPSTSPMNA